MLLCVGSSASSFFPDWFLLSFHFSIPARLWIKPQERQLPLVPQELSLVPLLCAASLHKWLMRNLSQLLAELCLLLLMFVARVGEVFPGHWRQKESLPAAIRGCSVLVCWSGCSSVALRLQAFFWRSQCGISRTPEYCLQEHWELRPLNLTFCVCFKNFGRILMW